MARFRFGLQPALDRARAGETVSRAVIVDAWLNCDGAITTLAAVEARLADQRVGPSGLRDAGSLAAAEAAGIALGMLCRQQASRVREARTTLGRARRAYATVARERSALESLRERRFAEHRRLAELAELAEADESNALRSGATSALRESGTPSCVVGGGGHSDGRVEPVAAIRDAGRVPSNTARASQQPRNARLDGAVTDLMAL